MIEKDTFQSFYLAVVVFNSMHWVDVIKGAIMSDYTKGNSMSLRFIRLPQVKAMVGLGTTAIYDKIKKGKFPRQVKLGRVSGWVESEVQDWINQQILANRPEASTTGDS